MYFIWNAAILYYRHTWCASLAEQDRILKVNLNDIKLDNVENDKVLGVHINNNLFWEHHTNSVL